MSKVILVGVLGIIILIFASYYIFIKGQSQNYSPTNNTSWVNDLIKKEENNSVANPPSSLTKCIYKNQTVYYLPPRCCDIPGVLYNDMGNVICYPDGGITGRGDGKCEDYFKKRTGCTIVWKDSRSR